MYHFLNVSVSGEAFFFPGSIREAGTFFQSPVKGKCGHAGVEDISPFSM